MLELVSLAVDQAANPFALVGYIAIGAYVQRLWHAIKFGFLWGLAFHIFAIALGSIDLLDPSRVLVTGLLRVTGAVLVTIAVFYLARAVRGHGGRPRGPGGRRRRSRLRAVGGRDMGDGGAH
ncbi:MAG: hypothetical protein ACE5Q3_10160 [Alphaproteobacteria bacterium]